MEAYEQQPGESPQAFQAYKVYRDMGPGRSRRLVAEKLGKNESLISRWQGKHNWTARARQRDEFIESIQNQAIEDFQRNEAVSLAEKESEIQHAILDLRLASAKKANQMAAYPLVETVKQSEDGREITLKPARWSFATIRSLAYTAAGAGIDNADILSEVENLMELKQDVIDVSALTEEEIVQLDELHERLRMSQQGT